MIEFEPHDYFTGKTDRKVSRELFQEHVRKTYDQIRELADYIEQYEGTIDTEFKKIVTHVNEQVKQLTDLYNDLLDNNVLDSAIQEKLLQLEQNYTPRLSTLEQNDVSLTAQLQQKATKGEIELSDLNKNKIQYDETWFADSVKQQWAGDTPIHTEPANFGITTLKLADKSVSSEKTDFIETSKNLFNHTTETVGYRVGVDGLISPDAGYGYSDFIMVEPMLVYSYFGFIHVAYYGENYNFISRVSMQESGGTITIPENVYFIRLNHRTAGAFKNAQINEGSILLPFEPWNPPYLKDVKSMSYVDKSILNQHLAEKIISADKVINKAITRQKTDFIKSSTNLFNANTEINGFVISNVTGEPTVNDKYKISDFVKISPSSDYSYVGFNSVAYYNADGVFITPRVTLAYAGSTDKSPDNAYYARVSYEISSSNQGGRRINEGGTVLPHEPFYSKFEVGSGLEELNTIIQKQKINYRDRYMMDVPIDGVFTTNETYPDYSGFSDVKTAQVYAMFDDLMVSYPDYITKEILGHDSLGNPIAIYYLSPQQPSADKVTKIPKIFITCGTHGYEHASTLSLYLTIKQMCEKWRDYPHLEALRFNVNFMIMPVVNPSGWDAFTRFNANLVDLNRNFPAGWSFGNEGETTYTGPSPASEIETQIVMDVFNNHPDIDIMYDFHNFHGSIDEFMWIPTTQTSVPYIQHMAQNLFSSLTRTWKKEYDFIPDDYFAGYTSSSGGGGWLCTYAESRGIKYTGVLEISWRWMIEPESERYNNTMCKAGVETFTNWLLINLREFLRSE